jgi:hypothetical protein
MINLTFGLPKLSLKKDPETDSGATPIFTVRNFVIASAVVAGIVILKQQMDIRYLTQAVGYMQQTNEVIVRAVLRG